jgi:alkanesulfonate monooxygenase SsuD/methylene tetrahydromethanopterin reductase-like flavin-dependent oxidoreductase (luciferase family)
VPGITAWPAASRRSTISRPGGRPGTWSPSVNQGEADNFGLTRHLGHDERYDAADEFLELTFQLWDSWQPNALVLDREEGIYADPARVRPVDHKGRFFSCRGPLNIPRSPQGRPVIIQAGSSACGQDFAARWAEIVFSIQPDEQGMRRFYLDHRSGPSGRAAIRLR